MYKVTYCPTVKAYDSLMTELRGREFNTTQAPRVTMCDKYMHAHFEKGSFVIEIYVETPNISYEVEVYDINSINDDYIDLKKFDTAKKAVNFVQKKLNGWYRGEGWSG